MVDLPPPAPPSPPAPTTFELLQRDREPQTTRAATPARSLVARAAVVLTAVSLVAGLLLVYEFGLSGIPESRMQSELLAAFKLAVPTTTLDAPSATPKEGSPVALLRIPRLGLTQVVIEGSSATDLKNGPGHLSASPLPGEYGNAVIEGRRTTYGSPFGSIGSLRKGDGISVATGQGAFTFTISKVTRVSAGQHDVVGTTQDSRLTLVTSDPPLIPTGRLAVIATLKGPPVAVATRPPALESATQLGLTGDFGGLGLGIIWFELLVVAAVLCWMLRHRLPRSVLYMFAAPVMTTLALLTYASLDSLLPGTM